MILAEVKINDGEEFITKLFATSMTLFQKMADKRYVAVGRTIEFDEKVIIDSLRKTVGWEK
jgi:uncharacterized spore protein YtfJ